MENFYLVIGSRKVIQILNVNSEEEDIFENVSEDDLVGMIVLVVVVEDSEEILMEPSNFIDVGK